MNQVDEYIARIYFVEILSKNLLDSLIFPFFDREKWLTGLKTRLE